MARITKEEYRASAASGLNLRDVVAAWLVCALVASIALAVSSDLHARPAFHEAVTTQQGMKEKAPIERFETVMPPGQSVAVSIPRVAGEAPGLIVLTNAGGHQHTAEPAAWGFAQ